MSNKNLEMSCCDCLIRLANSIQSIMKANGYKVSSVTVGSGYNDFIGIKNFEKVGANKLLLPEDYQGYTDAGETQYIISGRTLKSLYGESLSNYNLSNDVIFDI